MSQIPNRLLIQLTEAPPEVHAFLQSMLDEYKHAKKKHPSNALKLAAVGEEHGEVCKAILDEPWANVYKECSQLASTAMRLASEGDSTIVTERLNRNLDCPFP